MGGERTRDTGERIDVDVSLSRQRGHVDAGRHHLLRPWLEVGDALESRLAKHAAAELGESRERSKLGMST